MLVFNVRCTFTGAYVARVVLQPLYRLLLSFAAIVWGLCRNRGSFWTYIRLGMPKAHFFVYVSHFFLKDAGSCSFFEIQYNSLFMHPSYLPGIQVPGTILVSIGQAKRQEGASCRLFKRNLCCQRRHFLLVCWCSTCDARSRAPTLPVLACVTSSIYFN